MKNYGVRAICLAMVGLFVLCGGVAYSQSTSNLGLPWDALIKLSASSVGAGIGISWGSGTLTQAGKDYPLKVEGLTVGNVGINKATALGKVYNLKQLSDINGTYAAIGTGATVGGGGAAITNEERQWRHHRCCYHHRRYQFHTRIGWCNDHAAAVEDAVIRRLVG